MCIRDRTLAVPPYRVDVQRDCDVIEDILRTYGYNNVEIPTTLNSSLTTKGEHDKSCLLYTSPFYFHTFVTQTMISRETNHFYKVYERKNFTLFFVHYKNT